MQPKWRSIQPEVSEIEAVVYHSLKEKKRSGWLLRGIPPNGAESILEHSQKVRKATLIYASQISGVDAKRAALIALVHDIAEFETPDFTPHDNISRHEKYAQERAVLEGLLEKGGHWVNEIMTLWVEYEAKLTQEAQIVDQLDKLDAAVQALVYERQHYDVAEFFPYTFKKLRDPVLIQIYEILLEREFQTVDVYYQYYSLLRLRGNKEEFRSLMRAKI